MDIRNKIVEVAKTFIGTAYSELDCSAFCREVFRQFGYELPRVSATQGKHLYDKGLATKINKTETKGEVQAKLKVGDLMWWGHPNWPERWLEIHHVGIYIGNGEIIESSGDGVHISKLWETSKWQLVLIGDITSLLTNIESEENEVIKQGDEGITVYLFQHACKKAGHDPLKPGETWEDMKTGENNGCDGEFGPHMALVTASVQDKHGLPKTGEVDNLTYGCVVSEINGNEENRAAFEEIIGIAKAAL